MRRRLMPGQASLGFARWSYCNDLPAIARWHVCWAWGHPGPLRQDTVFARKGA